jgi:hypothetical protein
VQVATLGPLEVRTGSGELLEVGGARLRTLLIMLALRLTSPSAMIEYVMPPGCGAP